MIIGEKKYGLEKTDRATKTSLFDRNWATLIASFNIVNIRLRNLK
jgi:hypothetical protein